MPSHSSAERATSGSASSSSESLDHDPSIERLVELAIPRLADWCFVDLRADDGASFETVALAHHLPRGEVVAAALIKRYLPNPETELPIGAAMRERRTLLFRDISAAFVHSWSLDGARVQALEAMRMRSLLVAPLIFGDSAIGALSLVSCERNFEAPDATFAAQLAASISDAIHNHRLLAAERRAKLRVSKLHDLTAALSRASTAQEVAAAACEIGKEALGAQSGALWLVQPDGSLLLSGTAGVPAEHVEDFRVIPANAAGVPALEVLRTGQPVWVENEADYRRSVPAYFEIAKAMNRITAFGAVPIAIAGRLSGVLVFTHAPSHTYDELDRALYATLAHHCSQALDRARLLDSQIRANERLRLLSKAGETLSSSLDLDQTLRSLAKLVVPAFADWCVVDLVEGSLIRRVAVENRDPRKVAASLDRAARGQARVGDGSAIANVIARARSHFHARLPPEVIQAAARGEEELARLQNEGLISAIVVPLMARGACIGALSLTTSDSGRVYEESDVEFVEELGRRAGMAIANARLHRAVAEAHELWRQALAQAPMSIAIYFGPEHLIEFANPMYLSVGGRDSTIIGRRYADVFPEAVDVGLPLLDTVYRDGQPRTFADVRILLDRGDGPAERFFHISLVALKNEHGQIDRLMSVSFEVTDRVIAQRALDAERARLKNVFRQAPFPIGVFQGPEHEIVFANEKWEAMLGRSLPTGQRLVEAVPELRAQGVLGMHDRAFAGETVVGREIPLELQVDGKTRLHHFHVVLHPLVSDSGVIEGHVTMALDVTAQVLAQGELETARAEAVAANRAKDEFLAMLGHELRNPLAPIVTALDLLERRSNPDLKLELNIISRQVAHLTRLVDDLLDISRITRGKVELRKEVVEIAAVIERALESAVFLFEQREIALEVAVPNRGLLVNVDVQRMTQVLLNLLTNAVKYTRERGHVSIVAERVDREVVVRVVDDGIGIHEAMSQKIFEPFVQDPQGLDRTRGGLGLGLAIVKSFVEIHGGRVEVHSDGPGRGSAFSVHLLASPVQSAESDPVAGDAGRNDLGWRDNQPRRVLVVDDNEDAAELLALGLEAAGHTVVTTLDAPRALAALETFTADVAILDIGLPGMDGYELASRIRAQRPHVGLIALTGYGQPADRERTREAGFQIHLVKPTSVERVLDALASLGE